MLLCRVPRRLGQHFLRPASVERLLRVIDPAPEDVFLEIGPGRGALTLPLAARCARARGRRARRRGSPRACGDGPVERGGRRGDALGRTCARSSRAGAGSSATCPTTSRARCCAGSSTCATTSRDLHVMLQEEVARRVASPPGSKEYGILSVLYALWADTDIPAPLPARRLRPAAQGRLRRPSRQLPEYPRAEVPDLAAFERFVQKAFTRRRRTLENNLQDSYANLKEYLRFLNIEGSRGGPRRYRLWSSRRTLDRALSGPAPGAESDFRRNGSQRATDPAHSARRTRRVRPERHGPRVAGASPARRRGHALPERRDARRRLDRPRLRVPRRAPRRRPRASSSPTATRTTSARWRSRSPRRPHRSTAAG